MTRLLYRISAGACLAAAALTAQAAKLCPPTAYEGNPALCDTNPAAPNQVNISGATLFRAFFAAPASTNDFIDVDGDGCAGFDPNNCFPNTVDQLAPPLTPSDGIAANTHWLVHYRGVGSIEGVQEFVNYQLCGNLPDNRPTERSTFNSVLYWDGSTRVWPGPTECLTDIDGDGLIGGANPLGGPPNYCMCAVDLAITDVPSKWAFISVAAGTPVWDRKPDIDGYGRNPNVSYQIPHPFAPTPGPLPSLLADRCRPCGPGGSTICLNNNTATPDTKTIFDTQIAFVAVVPIVNRGTGLKQATYSDMQYHFTTGRRMNGENLAASTRDVGSGTRNAWCNSLGIDPSWGRGDNFGGRTTNANQEDLGPWHRVSNSGSSSHLENGVQQRRLAFGYTGISGDTAACADALAGRYEIIDVIKDIAPYNATRAVRPSVKSILDNADPNYGYTIGASQTFQTLGDPAETDPNSPAYMCNSNAADYLNNITGSIAGFIADPTLLANELSPGQYLAQTFFLQGSTDAEQSLSDPVEFVDYPDMPADPNYPGSPRFPALQSYARDNNNFGTAASADGVVTPAYGSRNEAGLTPRRVANPDFNENGVADESYLDGSIDGSYVYYWDADNDSVLDGTLQLNAAVENGDGDDIFILVNGTRLGERNRIAGDFDSDGDRDLDDITGMMTAITSPLMYEFSDETRNKDYEDTVPPIATGSAGDQVANVVIAHVIGDFDGDGNFDAGDIWYFGDGLAIDPDTGDLSRKLGFTRIDQNAAGGRYFTAVNWDNGAAYVAGDARFDVFGNIDPLVGKVTQPGNNPVGHNNVIDEEDYCYVLKNVGDWHDIDTAILIDLSCDMNGDLVVGGADLYPISSKLNLGSAYSFGDANGDCVVENADLQCVLDGWQKTPGQGGYSAACDFNGDLVIENTDLQVVLDSWQRTCASVKAAVGVCP
jgi:hypothetical protein